MALSEKPSRNAIKERHYVRKASSDNYWFDFSQNVINKYVKRFDRRFCLVITRNDEISDAYVLPFEAFSRLFSESTVDKRRRWVGTILNDIVKIHSSGVAMDVSDYYNRFDLLEIGEPELQPLLPDPLAQNNDDLQKRLAEFNRQFKEASPQKKLILSERIARPGTVSNILRKIHNHVCQLCQLPGFKKRNGKPYAEVHHVVELHKLMPGSYCSDNLIVVCPTCHKKLHYAYTELRLIDDKSFEINFGDGFWITVNRNQVQI